MGSLLGRRPPALGLAAFPYPQGGSADGPGAVSGPGSSEPGLDLGPVAPDTEVLGTEDGAGLFGVKLSELDSLDLLQIAAVLLATFLVSRALQRGLARTFKVRGVEDEGTLSVIQRLTHYAVMGLGIFLAFKIAHIDLTALAAAGAIFAVVVGFAMQNLSENFVSGVILMVERSIKQGDVLEVDGQMVRVASMGVRATVARTLDEEDLIIPNSAMVKDTVKNYTLDDRVFRLHTRVGVSYASDMRQVRRALEQAARDLPFRSVEHEPRVLMVEFADSSVVWDVSIWMRNPWFEQTALSQLNEAIWFALNEAGVTIAYPQLDLHLDPELTSALREASARALS